MPDPVDPTPVKVVPKGDGFAIVSAQGRTIDTAPTRERAHGVARSVSKTWDEAKKGRRAKGAPEITQSHLDAVLADIEEGFTLGRFEERLHPRQHGKFAAKHLDAANAGRLHRFERGAKKAWANAGDTAGYRDVNPSVDRAMRQMHREDDAAVRKLRRSLKEALDELEEDFLPHGRPHGFFGAIHRIHFDPAKHPRARGGKFTDVLGKLAHGGTAELPSGVTVRRHGRDAYEVEVPGEADRVTGILPRPAMAAQHGGHAELHTRKAAATHALIAHHEVTLGKRGTLKTMLASNKLVERERKRVAKELRSLHQKREGFRQFVGRLTVFGHELSSDKEVPAWARWGMKLAVTVAVVPIIPGDELLGPLIVGALMVRPSTRHHVKQLWEEAGYRLPPEVDIPTSEKVERVLRRSWARVEGKVDDLSGDSHPRLIAALQEMEEAVGISMSPTRRGSSRRSTPAGRSGSARGTSGAAVVAQSAQAATAAAKAANTASKATKTSSPGSESTSSRTSPEEDPEEKTQTAKPKAESSS